MTIINTTIRCSKDEHELINTTSKQKGFPTVVNFINYCLEKNIPLKEKPFFDFTINRSLYRIGAKIPKQIHNKLMQNVKDLNSYTSSVKMYHVALKAILMECEV